MPVESANPPRREFLAQLRALSGLCLAGIAPWREFISLWSTWWVGHAIGDLVAAPFLFVWVDQARRGWRIDRSEALLLLTGMLVLSLAVFVDRGANAPYPIHYLIFPAVIWAAHRVAERGRRSTSARKVSAAPGAADTAEDSSLDAQSSALCDATR